MKKKPLIGVIVPVLARSFIRDILRGAIAQLRLCGCDAIILAPLIQFESAMPAHARTEREVFHLIDSPDFDAFLYLKDEATMDAPVLAEIQRRLLDSQKYVMTVDELAHPVFDSTQYDDYDDFSRIVGHLIEVHGYRRIYCLTGPVESHQAQTRLRAWKDRMTQYGLFFDETYYEHGTFWYDSAIAYAKKLLSGEIPMPEAIVCGNDVMAVSLIKELIAGGVRIPEDVAVTGYDGYPFTADTAVTLTTYTRNHMQLGADAVRRLYRNLTGLLSEKAQGHHNGFCVGSSCGCTNIPAKQLISDPDVTIPRMWADSMFGISMTPDLAQAKAMPDLLSRAMYYGKMLYGVQGIRVFLSEPEGRYRLAASYEKGALPQLHTELLPPDSAAAFLTGRSEPEILFLSPLHLNARQFGLISLQNSGNRVYDESWLHFVTELVIALDRLPETNAEQQPASKSVQNRNVLCEKLRQIRQKMQEAPEETWTVERLCTESNLPKSTLQKHYKQQFGKSLFEDLIAFRVDAAKRLLSETSLPLGEISVLCGYSAESYFMKQFKRITGMTPTEYRNKN
ncbi:MAG: substrate-binding domain-containing protein [Oscillospiraceae bacterium]|nr:substrate-binding domain-containing protein [Oscillospiraceae bacterium]